MEQKTKKAKVLTSVAAVALAASMLIGGGTYAYLQGETEDVVNNFDTNEVTVDLTETTGSNYEIIPGTTQAKDPKVTVNATVDAYVYVTVDDATDGLVTYTMADGWTQLEGYDNVYYREVTASDAEQEFDVLAGNQVSYDAALTNTYMVDADGNLKEGLELTFSAYAIQKDTFANAAEAWVEKDTEFVKDQDNLISALAQTSKVVLSQNVAISTPENTEYNMLDGATIDLNNKELTVPFMTAIFQGNNAKIKNGSITSDANYPIFIGNGTKDTNMTLENVTSNGGVNVFAATCVLKNCTMDASGKTYYAVWADEGATIIIESGTYIGGPGMPAVNIAQKDAEVIIKGGKFNTDVSDYVADGYKVETSVEDGNTWYTVVPA